MLQSMREKIMGGLGWVVIGLIIMTFALFGLSSYLGDDVQLYAARVNGTEISLGELQSGYQEQRARMERMMGDNYNPLLMNEAFLKKQALDALIGRQLLLQAAAKEGLLVSDQLLSAQIRSIPQFQEGGSFNEEKYIRTLARQGKTTAQFEYETRRLITVQQLVSGLSNTVFVTDNELDQIYALQDQKRDYASLILPAKPLEETIAITDEQVQKYYDTHSDEFMIPERLKVEYVRLTADQIAENVEVEESDITALYDERKESLIKQEQRRASHILISVASDANEATIEKAKNKADDLVQKIADGASFEELAKESSEDPGSAAQGGDLGFFATGAMVPEFDEAVFAMESGTVSDPIRSQFGFHIIKLVEIQGAEMLTLDAVHDELAAEISRQAADEAFYDQLEQLADASYEQPDSLNAAAEALGLEIQVSDWLTTMGGEGVGAYPKVVAAAFSEDVREAGNNSEPVEVTANDVIVVRMLEREVAHPSDLGDVKEKIITVLKRDGASQQAKESGEILLGKLDSGASLESLKDQEHYVYDTGEGIARSAPLKNKEIVRALFKLPRPDGETPVNKGFQTTSGDYALIQLTKVLDAPLAALSDDARKQLALGFENMEKSAALASLLDDLRKDAEIVISEQAP